MARNSQEETITITIWHLNPSFSLQSRYGSMVTESSGAY